MKAGSLICRNESDEPVVVRSGHHSQGSFIVSVAEIGRLSSKIVPEDVAFFAKFLEELKSRSWFKTGTKSLEQARSLFDAQTNRETYDISLMAIAELSSSDCFTMSNFLKKIKAYSGVNIEFNCSDILDYWRSEGVLSFEKDSWCVDRSELRRTARIRGLDPFIRRIKDE